MRNLAIAAALGGPPGAPPGPPAGVCAVPAVNGAGTTGAGVGVAGGTGAVEFAGGITAGCAASLAGAGPLFAAMGAVAQLPTQWSAGFGAACAAIVAAVKANSRNSWGSMGGRERRVMGIDQPR